MKEFSLESVLPVVYLKSLYLAEEFLVERMMTRKEIPKQDKEEMYQRLDEAKDALDELVEAILIK